VVEDEAMLLDVVAAELADAGFRVLCAASAEEADGMLGAGGRGSTSCSPTSACPAASTAGISPSAPAPSTRPCR
jgi:hypothetical protein